MGECNPGGRCNGCDFPSQRPIEWIVRTGTWLRYKNKMGPISRLDEMMAANIRHDFSSRKNLHMDFLLNLMTLLEKM